MSSGFANLIAAAIRAGAPPDVDRAKDILIPEILLFTLATIAVFARLYVRLRVRPKLWWDDWTMFIAYVSLEVSTYEGNQDAKMAEIGLGHIWIDDYYTANSLRAWTPCHLYWRRQHNFGYQMEPICKTHIHSHHGSYQNVHLLLPSAHLGSQDPPSFPHLHMACYGCLDCRQRRAASRVGHPMYSFGSCVGSSD